MSLSEGWVQKHMSRNVPVLVTPRYDQIKVEGNAVTLVTPSAEVVVDGYTVQGPEPYVIPTYGKFKDRFKEPRRASTDDSSRSRRLQSGAR